jgi:2,3-bisphosphoglycerate-dependent phosphoglycerate mutase
VHLYLIRHAQSVNNALFASGAGDQVRSHDPELTELGYQQAKRLAEFLAGGDPKQATDRGDSQDRRGFGLTHLYASLMVRAVATGTIVAERLGLPLNAWIDWHEEGGVYLDGDDGQRLSEPGLGRSYFARQYPGLVLPEALDDAGWWNRPFEELDDRPVRARRVLARLIELHGGTNDRVAVISHGGFYNHFMGALLDALPPYKLSYLMNNTGISRIIFTPEGHYLVYQNRCEHLPAGMVTY